MDEDNERRKQNRVSCHVPLPFTILSMNGREFQRTQSIGTIVDVCEEGVEVLVDFPLLPGHVLHWDDIHRPGRLHIAVVKWSMEHGDMYRGGLMFI